MGMRFYPLPPLFCVIPGFGHRALLLPPPQRRRWWGPFGGRPLRSLPPSPPLGIEILDLGGGTERMLGLGFGPKAEGLWGLRVSGSAMKLFRTEAIRVIKI